MGYFPLCMDITGKPVILVGNGSQIRKKMEILRPFGCEMVQMEALTEQTLDAEPAFVVVGDLPYDRAAEAAFLCRNRRIPVNVVDRPELCTFFFPALIREGDLTISVSTGGKHPGTAAFLRRRIRAQIPEGTDRLLDWLAQIRQELREARPGDYAAVLGQITEAAFQAERPLTEQELEKILA